MENSTPVPPTPPGHGAPTTPAGWWRRPLADVVDLLCVAGVAALAGAVVGGAALASSSDELFAELVALLVGMAAAGVVFVVGWVVLLLAVRRGRRTPGERLLGAAPTGRALAAAGRHVAIVITVWALLGVAASLTEPPPTGPAVAAVAAGAAAAMTVLAYGWGPPSTRVAIVVTALVAGGALAGAVPDREPYAWELRSADDADLGQATPASSSSSTRLVSR